MRQGAIAQTGTPRDVYFRPADAFVADFVGMTNRLSGSLTAGHFTCACGVLAIAGPDRSQATLAFRPESIALATGETALRMRVERGAIPRQSPARVVRRAARRDPRRGSRCGGPGRGRRLCRDHGRSGRGRPGLNVMLIAQITDTHIRPPGRLAYRVVDTNAHLGHIVAHVAALRPVPDIVVVTGDLTDFDDADEYRRFREIVAPLTMLARPIPGNHDSSAGMRVAFPEHAPPERNDMCYVVDGFPLRLVLLDSTVPGAPYGHLGPARLDWLARVLAAAPHRPSLIALHHPPFEVGIRHMDVQNCRDGAALAAILQRHTNVVGLICGHIHRSIVTTFAGVAASVGPGPAHAVSLDLDPSATPSFRLEPPSIHLHWFDAAAGRLVTHQSFVGDTPGPVSLFRRRRGVDRLRLARRSRRSTSVS